MFIDTSQRTDDSELMDDFSMQGEALHDNLDEIAQINRLLGGNSVTLEGVRDLLKKIPKSEEIVIADIGCGNGDMLRILSRYGEKNGWNFRLIGIDANAFTIAYARELSALYPNINYHSLDVLGSDFEQMNYDVALCTLTLHHFSDAELMRLMQILKKQSSIGVVVNDLHRNALAYRLFQLVGFVFRLKDVSKNDGLVSIRRGFKKSELIGFSKKLNSNNYTVRWKWAFRYQWIISKI